MSLNVFLELSIHERRKSIVLPSLAFLPPPPPPNEKKDFSVLGEVRLVSAQNKNLISDTDIMLLLYHVTSSTMIYIAIV